MAYNDATHVLLQIFAKFHASAYLPDKTVLAYNNFRLRSHQVASPRIAPR
jgi:hypothetical protein